MKKHNDAEKQTVLAQYSSGKSVSNIVSNTGIPRSTIYSWIKRSAEIVSKKKNITPHNFRLLENKITRLEGIIEIMKKADCAVSDPLEIKLPELEKLQGQYNKI